MHFIPSFLHFLVSTKLSLPYSLALYFLSVTLINQFTFRPITTYSFNLVFVHLYHQFIIMSVSPGPSKKDLQDAFAADCVDGKVIVSTATSLCYTS